MGGGKWEEGGGSREGGGMVEWKMREEGVERERWERED